MSHSIRSPWARFSVASAALLRTCAARSGEVHHGDCHYECDDEKQSELKVTMSMMTTMTAVLNRIFRRIGQISPFPLYKLLVFKVFVGLHGVAASCLVGLRDRALVSVVTPLLGSGYAIVPLQRCKVKFFHVSLRVSLFVHAFLILLITEITLHDRSAIVLERGIRELFCSLEFFRFLRFSEAPAPFGILQR